MPPIIYQILYLRHSQKSSTLQKSSSKLMVDTSLVVLVMKAYHAFIMRGILLIPNSGYYSKRRYSNQEVGGEQRSRTDQRSVSTVDTPLLLP